MHAFIVLCLARFLISKNILKLEMFFLIEFAFETPYMLFKCSEVYIISILDDLMTKRLYKLVSF